MHEQTQAALEQHSGQLLVLLRMLGALETIGAATENMTRKSTLLAQAQCIAEVAERTLKFSHDRTCFTEQYARVRASLEQRTE